MIALALLLQDAEGFLASASKKQMAGDFDGAIRDYTLAIGQFPEYGAAYAGRAACWLQKQNFKAAVTDARRAINLDPEFAPTYRTRSLALYCLQDWKGAMADLQKVCELQPKQQDEPRLWIWLMQARLEGRQAATQALKSHFKKLPKPAAYLAGELSEEEFLKTARGVDYLFAATARLIDLDKEPARELFKKCVEAAPKTSRESLAAAAELKLLD